MSRTGLRGRTCSPVGNAGLMQETATSTIGAAEIILAATGSEERLTPYGTADGRLAGLSGRFVRSGFAA
jgi:hypothetical protein